MRKRTRNQKLVWGGTHRLLKSRSRRLLPTNNTGSNVSHRLPHKTGIHRATRVERAKHAKHAPMRVHQSEHASRTNPLVTEIFKNVVPLSAEDQLEYDEQHIFPSTICYYTNDAESRDYWGMNHSEMRNVSVNTLLAKAAYFECIDLDFFEKTPAKMKGGDGSELNVVDTSDLPVKFDGFRWFSSRDTKNAKILQFINYYIFSQNYQTTSGKNSVKLNDIADQKFNLSVISEKDTESDGVMYRSITKNFLVKIGQSISRWATRHSNVCITKNKPITYEDLNTKGSTKIIKYTEVDKLHLLYSIFLKMLCEMDKSSVKLLFSILGLSLPQMPVSVDDNKTPLTPNDHYDLFYDELTQIKTHIGENIPYHLIMETILPGLDKTRGQIQTVINPICWKWSLSWNPNIILAKMHYYLIHGNVEKYQPILYEIKTDYELITVPPNRNVAIDNTPKTLEYKHILIPPDVTFIGKDGHGKITDGNGKIWFYDKSGVTDQDGQKIDDKTYSIYSTVDSRIPHKRTEILCYLSELIYSPNDVVEQVSGKIFDGSLDLMKMKVKAPATRGTTEKMTSTNSRIIYLGGYDHDPSYPYVFDSADNNALKPSYSRIHAWLYINNNAKRDETEPYHELYIVNRGSKTALDWGDIDKAIEDGTALYNARPLSYSEVVQQILNKIVLNDIYLTKMTSHKQIQIFSSGHSLGGFLGLYFSFMSLSRFTTHNIKDVEDKWNVNRYIFPIVFQPYIRTETIIDTYSKLPAGMVSTVVNKSFAYDSIYTDIASYYLCDYIDKHPTVGGIQIYKYENVYINKLIYTKQRDANLLLNRFVNYTHFTDIISNAHALWQMSGLCLKYYAEHVRTNFYVKTDVIKDGKEKDQSLEVTKYQFNVENDCVINSNTNGSDYTAEALTNIRTNVEAFLIDPNSGGSR